MEYNENFWMSLINVWQCKNIHWLNACRGYLVHSVKFVYDWPWFAFYNPECVPNESWSLNLFTLMFANDMVLFSESETTTAISSRWINWMVLSENVAKFKIVIFLKCGKVRNDAKWVLRDENLDTVNSFTYLGMVFNFTNKFPKTEKQFAVQDRKPMYL